LNLLDFKDPADRLLGRSLRRQAEAVPDTDFIMWDEEHFSYARVNELSNASARAFREIGIGPGDTVSFLLETCPDWIWATFGINKLGAAWVPTNVDYKGRWLAESLEDGGARILVADAHLLPRVAELGGHRFEKIFVRGDASALETDLGVPLVPIEELVAKPGDEPDDSERSYGEITAILWTSGTTGRSKGVMQSNNVWIRAGLSGVRNSFVRDGDVVYNCLPMYQSAAWVANVYRALVAGIPCAMDPAFSASNFWDRTRHYNASLVFTLGAMHMFLLNAPERDDDDDNPVRVAGFVPTPDHLIPVFKERFGIEEIFQGYGQSEVLGLINRAPGKTYAPNALGELDSGLEVRLLDDDDNEVAPGEPGEFCVRPTEPHTIFSGYWRNPEATLQAFRNLWYHTGDLGRRDAGGRLLLRRPQAGLHPLQGPQHLVILRRSRTGRPPGSPTVRRPRCHGRRAGIRSRAQGLHRPEARARSNRRRDRALRQRHRPLLLRPTLHRILRRAAPDTNGSNPEVQAERERRHPRNLGRQSGRIQSPTLRRAAQERRKCRRSDANGVRNLDIEI
jgi:crotonobetaine/carnitine-CoA ligase